MIIFIFSDSEGVVGIRGYRKQYIRRRDKTPPSWFILSILLSCPWHRNNRKPAPNQLVMMIKTMNRSFFTTSPFVFQISIPALMVRTRPMVHIINPIIVLYVISPQNITFF
jgi:hypothetical protein